MTAFDWLVLAIACNLFVTIRLMLRVRRLERASELRNDFIALADAIDKNAENRRLVTKVWIRQQDPIPPSLLAVMGGDEQKDNPSR